MWNCQSPKWSKNAKIPRNQDDDFSFFFWKSFTCFQYGFFFLVGKIWQQKNTLNRHAQMTVRRWLRTKFYFFLGRANIFFRKKCKIHVLFTIFTFSLRICIFTPFSLLFTLFHSFSLILGWSLTNIFPPKHMSWTMSQLFFTIKRRIWTFCWWNNSFL